MHGALFCGFCLLVLRVRVALELVVLLWRLLLGPRLAVLLAWDRAKVHFYATVLGTAIDVSVTGDRIIRAGAACAQVGGTDALGGQVVGHALRTALGKVHVQLTAAGAVGVADDLDGVLVELLEGVGQVVQRLVEAAGDRVGVGGEGDIAGIWSPWRCTSTPVLAMLSRSFFSCWSA
jgi:hypothetical protein